MPKTAAQGRSKRAAPKSFIMVAFLLSVIISYSLMFMEKNELFLWLQPYIINGNTGRNILLLFCFVFYCFRVWFSMFVFYRRKMYWVEAIIILSVMPFIFPYATYVSGRSYSNAGIVEIIGIAVYLFGSFLNSKSEYTRHIWKQKEENQGCLYTEGLFKYAIHVNYTGDVLLFTGIAIVAHSIHLLVVPAVMAFTFVVILIPLKNRYLKKKYKDQYINYQAKTKYLVPLIY